MFLIAYKTRLSWYNLNSDLAGQLALQLIHYWFQFWKIQYFFISSSILVDIIVCRYPPKTFFESCDGFEKAYTKGFTKIHCFTQYHPLEYSYDLFIMRKLDFMQKKTNIAYKIKEAQSNIFKLIYFFFSWGPKPKFNNILLEQFCLIRVQLRGSVTYL